MSFSYTAKYKTSQAAKKEKRKKDVSEIDNLLTDISTNYYKIEILEQKIKQDCIQNYIHAEIAIEQMCQKNTQHALELLGKYLSNLWY